MKAMVLAAGLGTRLGKETNSKPKALVEVEGVPLLKHVLLRLIKQDFTKIIINVHHFAEQIIRFVQNNDNFGIHIAFSHEERLLDTGGGLKNAAWFFDDDVPFLMHNVDVLTDLDLKKFMEAHVQNKSLATIAVRSRDTQRYVLFDETNQLVGWESLSPPKKRMAQAPNGKLNRLSFMGIHAFLPEIFAKMGQEGRFSIIDCYLDLAQKGEKIQAFRGDSSRWLDLGRIEVFRQAKKLLGADFFD
ncbi:MAG: nucleotidyltransferase family protein [Calditrichaeota bacterium]|nr:MAG: nucleotidyltransferase family protein [Calditrichota bacterium]